MLERKYICVQRFLESTTKETKNQTMTNVNIYFDLKIVLRQLIKARLPTKQSFKDPL